MCRPLAHRLMRRLFADADCLPTDRLCLSRTVQNYQTQRSRPRWVGVPEEAEFLPTTLGCSWLAEPIKCFCKLGFRHIIALPFGGLASRPIFHQTLSLRPEIAFGDS